MITLPWEKRKSYRAGILLGGDLHDTAESAALLASCDLLAVADRGASYARQWQLKPDIAVGDFDSIAADDLLWLQGKGIPIYQFAEAKDEADSELAAYLLLSDQAGQEGKKSAAAADIGPELSLIASGSWAKSRLRNDLELLFLGCTGSRPDHLLANLSLARVLTERGIPVLLSDGISLFVPLSGRDKVRILWPEKPCPEQRWLFSSMSLSDLVTGITYQSAQFPVENYSLPRGTSLGLSNRGLSPKQVDIGLELESGSLMVIVTGED
ncbi:MAG: thiamine pyrophosphokinase [Saccharofermentanales bacterium]|nr:thiamine pyrophosphokinase [Bacillota bacterium]